MYQRMESSFRFWYQVPVYKTCSLQPIAHIDIYISHNPEKFYKPTDNIMSIAPVHTSTCSTIVQYSTGNISSENRKYL